MAIRIDRSNKATIDLVATFGLGALVFYAVYNREKDLKTAGIFAGIAALVGYIITSQFTKQLVEATINNLAQTKQDEIATQYGLSTATLAECKEVSDQIFNAFYGADGAGGLWYDQDEDGAVNAINQCDTPDEVKAVCKIYQETYGKSLKADFTDKCHILWGADGSWNNINALVKQHWF